MVFRRVAVLAARWLLRMVAQLFRGGAEEGELAGRWCRGWFWRGEHGRGGWVSPKPAIVLVLAGLRAQVLGDLRPGFGPAPRAAHGA